MVNNPDNMLFKSGGLNCMCDEMQNETYRNNQTQTEVKLAGEKIPDKMWIPPVNNIPKSFHQYPIPVSAKSSALMIPEISGRTGKQK